MACALLFVLPGTPARSSSIGHRQHYYHRRHIHGHLTARPGSGFRYERERQRKWERSV